MNKRLFISVATVIHIALGWSFFWFIVACVRIDHQCFPLAFVNLSLVAFGEWWYQFSPLRNSNGR